MCIVDWSLLDNIAQGFYLFNVGLWLSDNSYEVNNLCNVALTMLGQHCLGIFSSRCCPNTSKTALQKKITCAMLAKGPQTCFCRNINYTMCMSQHCAKKLQCWPTVHKQLFTEKWYTILSGYIWANIA